MCLSVLFLSSIDIYCGFSSSPSLTYRNLFLTLLFLSYITIFDFYFIIFLPCEFFKFRWCIRARLKQLCRLVKVFHCCIINVTISACYRITYLIYVNLTCLSNYPREAFTLWYILLRLILSLDVLRNTTIIFQEGFFHSATGTLIHLVKTISTVPHF